MNWRRRLARWLVGPFLAFTEDGSWMVHRDGEFVIAIRVAEWHGTLETPMRSYTHWQPGDHDPSAPTTTGTFEGRFEN